MVITFIFLRNIFQNCKQLILFLIKIEYNYKLYPQVINRFYYRKNDLYN